ncbi:MAG: hypothetical protein ACQET7_14340 [Thermodesulfobacteriota bacterium]
MVFFANLGVNLRGCLCGVLQYASAQPLDFLDLDKKSSFLNWKLASARKAFLDGHYSNHTSAQSKGRLFSDGLIEAVRGVKQIRSVLITPTHPLGLSLTRVQTPWGDGVGETRILLPEETKQDAHSSRQCSLTLDCGQGPALVPYS